LIHGKHGQGTHINKIGAENWLKIPQRPQNLSAQFVCPSPKVWDFNEKRLHWATVVRENNQQQKIKEKYC
jgi:hypothetical protein